MAPTIDRWPVRATLLVCILLATALSVAACEKMDCANIATTGCTGSDLYDNYYDYYNRPRRD
jgi:hypothetical protein